MGSAQIRLNPTLLRTAATSAAVNLPWLPPRRPQPQSPRLSNAAVLRAVTSTSATPKQLLSLYSRAALQPNFRHDYPTYAALIPALALRRRLRAAALLLSRMRLDGLHPGPALLLPLLSACSAAGIPDSAAVRLLLSSPPSERAFSTLISALIRADRLPVAHSLLSHPDIGFPIKVHHYISLVRAYLARGSVDKAVELLDLMLLRNSVPDICCYGALIRGLPVGDAFVVVEQMRRAGQEPDVVMWNTLVHGCVRGGDVGRAEELVAEMERRGVRPDAGTYNGLVTGYRSVEDAFKVFDCMLERGVAPDVITFSTLMGLLGKAGRVLESNGLFGRMLKMGVSPDGACYRILSTGCCKCIIQGDSAAQSDD